MTKGKDEIAKKRRIERMKKRIRGKYGVKLKQSGIPKRLKDATIDKIPDDASHKKAIINYCKKILKAVDKGLSLVLYGGYGAGKSAAAAIIIKAYIKECSIEWIVNNNSSNFSAKFYEAASLVEKWHQKDSVGYIKRDEIRNSDLIVLDDIGKEYHKSNSSSIKEDDFFNSIFMKVINHRILEGKSTIITTNLSIEDFNKVYGHKMLNKMTEKFKFIEFDDIDLREKEAEEKDEFFDGK